MRKVFILLVLLANSNLSFSQKLLTSWSQQNIENYTKEMYDEAQELSSDQLLKKNLTDVYWSEVFLTLNASLNHHSKDTVYLQSLAEQITNTTETKLKGTSRLIIWERISVGDITFEGKGIVFENDLFTVAGRANQLLQSLTNKNFGFVTPYSGEKELEIIRNKWRDYLNGTSVEEFKPNEYPNSQIPEVSSLSAIEALIISLQENPKKEEITKNCLKNVYNLDALPKGKDSPAIYCNPDTYTYAYLAILFGDEKVEETKNAKWWLEFWSDNKNDLYWNSDKGFYELKM